MKARMSLVRKVLYRFDEFELDRGKRTLSRDGGQVLLSPKAYEVLVHLVIHAGDVVTKEELMQAVWPGSFVEEGNLAQQVSSIRKAFADRAKYIVTIPGRGYQFTAEVEQDIPARPAESALPGQPLIGLETVRERTHIVVEETTAPAHHNWRSGRTALWGVAVFLTVALAAVLGLRLAHRPTIGHAETVIADLENETGDTDFDHSLNRMLQIDLQQSPYFTIVGERSARGVLKLMRQPEDERITAPLAREICQRLNGQLYITPAIAKVGDRYLLTLEANDCVDGHSLGADHKETSSKSEVLAVFTALTRRVRQDVGESADSLRQFDQPLFNSYTSSLDALKAYSEATHFALAGRFAESIALYQHAVELDPQFAAAYADMASDYFNMGDEEHDREAVTKAYALRDTVNAYERFFIEYGYHASVTGDLPAELEVLRQWSATYPQDYIPLTALINLETVMGQDAAAAADADRMLDLQRRDHIHNATSYEMSARAYHRANMPDKFRAVYAEALQSKAESEGLHSIMLQFSAENGDTAGVQREIAWSRGKPEECRMLQAAGLAALAAGQVRRAETLFAEATVAAQRDKLQDTLADFDDYRARMLVELGLIEEARKVLLVLPPFDPTLDKAFTEAEVGNAAEAVAEAQRQQAAAPNDTLLNAVYFPSVRAAVALREGKPSEAVSLLQAAAPFELRDPSASYLRGQAFLAAHQSVEAAAEFEKIADHPWLANPAACLVTLAHLGIARALAQQDKFDASRRQYEVLFALFQGADDLPVLEQAHREYAHLPPAP
jgi:DNA-binding winged helix-turn-helix (wHTH) protein/tetratricopeptide (TPR) repeat protein